MRGEAGLPLATLLSFVMVLARVGGALVFVPIPGIRNGPHQARVVLALSFSVALFPLWPEIRREPGMAEMAGWMLSEAALGLSVGLVVTFLTEAFLIAMQIVGLQAGYAYASSIDPTTQADASVLLVFAQLMGGLLFFALGLHLEVMRIFAHSLAVYPPGQFVPGRSFAQAVTALGGTMFSTGLRLSLPILALLLLVDLALALMGRINAQLQLLTTAFPAKMLVGLGLLALMAALFPRLYRAYAGELFGVLRGVLLR